MRHQRQGWRRLVALPVALIGALVIAPGLASASPNTTGATGLDVTDCKATVAVNWTAQPGKYKTYTVTLSSDNSSTVYSLDGGAFGRAGHLILLQDLPVFGSANTFRAVTRVFDGKGVEALTWTSGDVFAACS